MSKVINMFRMLGFVGVFTAVCSFTLASYLVSYSLDRRQAHADDWEVEVVDLGIKWGIQIIGGNLIFEIPKGNDPAVTESIIESFANAINSLAGFQGLTPAQAQDLLDEWYQGVQNGSLDTEDLLDNFVAPDGPPSLSIFTGAADLIEDAIEVADEALDTFEQTTGAPRYTPPAGGATTTVVTATGWVTVEGIALTGLGLVALAFPFVTTGVIMNDATQQGNTQIDATANTPLAVRMYIDAWRNRIGQLNMPDGCNEKYAQWDSDVIYDTAGNKLMICTPFEYVMAGCLLNAAQLSGTQYSSVLTNRTEVQNCLNLFCASNTAN